MKGKALRRALETKDVIRINGDVPLIVDTTELITPEIAQEILHHNKKNRPINWKKVEEYADMMSRGEWALIAQGIVLDTNGDVLTGQQRLWAVVYSGVSIYMRVSRGNPPSTARLLDRGRPQSARDLASRETEKKHSPTEASIARAICVLNGNGKPSIDDLSKVIAEHSLKVSVLLEQTTGTRKSRSVVMLLAAICVVTETREQLILMAARIDRLSDSLDLALLPETSVRCWGKGAAFGLAMEQARRCVAEALG